MSSTSKPKPKELDSSIYFGKKKVERVRWSYQLVQTSEGNRGVHRADHEPTSWRSESHEPVNQAKPMAKTPGIGRGKLTQTLYETPATSVSNLPTTLESTRCTDTLIGDSHEYSSGNASIQSDSVSDEGFLNASLNSTHGSFGKKSPASSSPITCDQYDYNGSEESFSGGSYRRISAVESSFSPIKSNDNSNANTATITRTEFKNSNSSPSTGATYQKTVKYNLSPSQIIKEILSLHERSSSLNQGEFSAQEDINVSPKKNSSSIDNEINHNNSGHESQMDSSFPKFNESQSNHSNQFSASHNDLRELQHCKQYCKNETTALSGVLHGFIDIQPVTYMHEVALHPSLLDRMLNMDAEGLTRCQMYGIPVVASGRNFVLVAPPDSGRTMACTLPVVSQLLFPENYSQLRVGCGPRAVFLMINAEQVKSLGVYLSQFRRGLSVLLAHANGLEDEIKESLTNGCDILVTTPRCWLRLLRYKTVTTVDRLCHLVIDNFEVQLDLFTPEVTLILKLLKELNFDRKKNNINSFVQVAVVSERWSSELDDLLIRNPHTALHQPVVGFTAFLEAAIYAGVKPVVHFVTPSSLRQLLKKEVMAHADKCGVIVCKEKAEVKELWIELAPIRKNLLVAHGDMHPDLIKEARVKWHSSFKRSNSSSKLENPPLLLVSDPLVDGLHIQNAQWLFNYSIPDAEHLNSRFSTIQGLINDRIKDPQAASPSCKVEICIMESDREHLPWLVNILQRLKISIPNKIAEALLVLKMEQESISNNAPFCKRLLKFGKCSRESNNCVARHSFDPIQDVSKFPVSENFVKMDILHVVDASHFSARILGFSNIGNAGGNFSSWKASEDNAYIALKMSSYFGSRKNRIPHGRAQVGDMVAIKVDEDTLFRRARVIELISETEATKKTMKARILHVDHGLREIRKLNDLLVLPKALCKYPDIAVNVYLSKLLPLDFEVNWSYAANHLVRCKVGFFKKYQFYGEVKLVLGQNVIVDNLKCYNYLPESKVYVCQLNIRKVLLDNRLAVNNPDHLTALYDLCVIAGVDPPRPNSVTQNVIKKVPNDRVKPDWAFLNLEEFNTVGLAVSSSPALFIVKLTKYVDCLIALHKDLESAVTVGDCKPVSNPSHVEVNSYWIVLNEATWNRVMVLKPPNNDTVEVFFVDFGDTKKVSIHQLRSIPSRLIKQLPCQAIECSLVGVQPTDNEWSDAAYQYFCDLDLTYSFFYIKVCKTIRPATFTGGRHYSVVLFGTTPDPYNHVFINLEMISKGFANASETRQYLNSDFNLPKIDQDYSSLEDEAVMSLPRDSFYILSANDRENLPLDLSDLNELEFFRSENKETLEILNSEISVKESLEMRSNPTQVEQKPALRRLCLPRGTVEPYIYWRQDSESVCLRILIFDLDAKDAGFEWSISHLMFMALKNNRRYFCKIELFGPIDPETIRFNLTGQYYEVKLEKRRKNFPWSRLTSDDKKYLFIKVDPEHVKTSSKLMRRANQMYREGQIKLENDGDETKEKFLSSEKIASLSDASDSSSDFDFDNADYEFEYE